MQTWDDSSWVLVTLESGQRIKLGLGWIMFGDLMGINPIDHESSVGVTCGERMMTMAQQYACGWWVVCAEWMYGECKGFGLYF